MVGRLAITDQGFSFSGKAHETISGGQIVKVLSGATVLTTTNSLTDVIQVALADAAADVITVAGVADGTVISGQTAGVMTTGIHGFYAGAAVVAGNTVMAMPAVASADAVEPIDLAASSGPSLRFGKALSTGASGQMVAVLIG